MATPPGQTTESRINAPSPRPAEAVAKVTKSCVPFSSPVERAEDWRWSSLWRRTSGNTASRSLLARWPLAYPREWINFVNKPQTEAEVAAVRIAIRRGSPFGDEAWQRRLAKRLNLESTLRPRGRPKRSPK